MPVQIDATFPSDPSAPAEARARAAALALGLQDELADDVGRLASEIVADGVRTGDVEEIHLALRLTSGHVRVEVKAGERAARRFVDSPTLETALARTIVERLADRWGAEAEPIGLDGLGRDRIEPRTRAAFGAEQLGEGWSASDRRRIP